MCVSTPVSRVKSHYDIVSPLAREWFIQDDMNRKVHTHVNGWPPVGVWRRDGIELGPDIDPRSTAPHHLGYSYRWGAISRSGDSMELERNFTSCSLIPITQAFDIPHDVLSTTKQTDAIINIEMTTDQHVHIIISHVYLQIRSNHMAGDAPPEDQSLGSIHIVSIGGRHYTVPPDFPVPENMSYHSEEQTESVQELYRREDERKIAAEALEKNEQNQVQESEAGVDVVDIDLTKQSTRRSQRRTIPTKRLLDKLSKEAEEKESHESKKKDPTVEKSKDKGKVISKKKQQKSKTVLEEDDQDLYSSEEGRIRNQGIPPPGSLPAGTFAHLQEQRNKETTDRLFKEAIDKAIKESMDTFMAEQRNQVIPPLPPTPERVIPNNQTQRNQPVDTGMEIQGDLIPDGNYDEESSQEDPYDMDIASYILWMSGVDSTKTRKYLIDLIGMGETDIIFIEKESVSNAIKTLRKSYGIVISEVRMMSIWKCIQLVQEAIVALNAV